MGLQLRVNIVLDNQPSICVLQEIHFAPQRVFALPVGQHGWLLCCLNAALKDSRFDQDQGCNQSKWERDCIQLACLLKEN